MAAGFETGASTIAEELRRRLVPFLDEIAALIASPRHRFSELRKDEVPETAGLYVICCEEPFEVFYVGVARTRRHPLFFACRMDCVNVQFRSPYLDLRANNIRCE